MIKPIAVAVISLLAIPAQAQSPGDPVVSRYVDFMKSRAAVRSCVSEEGKMQLERNARYDALLRANAKDPAAPTIDEIFEAQMQLRAEDETLRQKRDECMPLFDQLVAAANELRRDCAAYAAPDTDGESTPVADARVIDICRGPAKK